MSKVDRKRKDCVKDELDKMCNVRKWTRMEGDGNNEQPVV